MNEHLLPEENVRTINRIFSSGSSEFFIGMSDINFILQEILKISPRNIKKHILRVTEYSKYEDFHVFMFGYKILERNSSDPLMKYDAFLVGSSTISGSTTWGILYHPKPREFNNTVNHAYVDTWHYRNINPTEFYLKNSKDSISNRLE